MRPRLTWLATLSCVAALAVAAASTAGAATSQLTVIGPWTGQNAASFQAVLQGFAASHSGAAVTYKPATGDVVGALPASGADLAVLSLPADQGAMQTLYTTGTIKSLDFVVPTMKKNYAWSWKQLGSTNGVLTGLFFKASDLSAFWYDKSAFKNLGLTAPTTWAELRQDAAKIRGAGLAPYAASGSSAVTLPNLFQNIYLTFQGNQRYDRLASGGMSWHDGSVMGALNVMHTLLNGRIAGGTSALSDSYATAVRKVFGSPMKAYMVPGGSAVLPLVSSSNTLRPLSKFGVFPFPKLTKKSAPKVIGDADAIVMAKDSPLARSLVEYLATPAAAEIWAKRGGDFISPNMNVAASAYAVPQMATLAQAVSSANSFRFPLADTTSKSFRQALNLQLTRYLRNPNSIGDDVARIAIAAGEEK